MVKHESFEDIQVEVLVLESEDPIDIHPTLHFLNILIIFGKHDYQVPTRLSAVDLRKDCETGHVKVNDELMQFGFEEI